MSPPASDRNRPQAPTGAEPELDFATRAVRAGQQRSEFDEHSEALFLTSSFVHRSAAHAAAKFAGTEPGFIYSRFGNPTISAFQDRLAALEGAPACLATASGMSAIMAMLMSLTRSGDHVICSRSVFGTTLQLFDLFARFGIRTSYVPLTDLAAWERAIEPTTRLMYLETPSNPLTEIADVGALSAIARKRGVKLVVDSCLCTPALQRPLEQGADIVVHSATKYLEGQGRVLGGAVLGDADYIATALQPVIRYCGPTLSAFNAWVLLKGLETLQIRMLKQSDNALQVARWLEQHPALERVYYPGLTSHPQHALASAQQQAGGALLAFVVKGTNDAERRERAWRVVDRCRLISITANLGDTKSTITHPATTTHGRMSAPARAEVGIGEGLLRVAVGLEAPRDLCADLARGLD